MCISSLNRILKCVQFVSGTPGLVFFSLSTLPPAEVAWTVTGTAGKLETWWSNTLLVWCASHWQTSQGGEKAGACEGWGCLGSTEPQARSGSGGRNTCLVSTMLREDMHPFQLLVHHLLCTPYLLCATQYTATRTTDMVSPQGGCSLTKKSDIK